MNFVSLGFVAFTLIVYGVYWSLPRHRARKIWLTMMSYVFYAFTDWRFCFLMLFVTVNAWATGRTVRDVGPRTRRRLLTVSIGIDLAVLGFFKYWGFFTNSFNSLLHQAGLNADLPLLQIILPVGISFYTFHAISYVLDIARGKTAPVRAFSDVALYIAFFPQLIAGPIVRASFFMPQLRRSARFFGPSQIQGLHLFLRGLMYKAVFADLMALVADPVFNKVDEYDNQALITATIAYYGQIYFDFAGYSAMAIGTARLFGYRLPRNFNYPYAAASLTDFWRRWHMSLSFWLRDYLYISLGGNRGGRFAFYRNLMITMVLGGLWHGAAWTFIVWGTLHGLGLCLHKVWLGMRERIAPASLWHGYGWHVAALLITQAWVMAAWVFFRSTSFSDALTILNAWVHWSGGGFRHIPHLEILILSVIAIDHLIGIPKPRLGLTAPHRLAQVGVGPSLHWFLVGVGLALILALMPLNQKPFIYFQF